MSPNERLPILHLNPRSQQITKQQVREVFAEETARFIDRRMDEEKYLLSVMPSG